MSEMHYYTHFRHKGYVAAAAAQVLNLKGAPPIYGTYIRFVLYFDGETIVFDGFKSVVIVVVCKNIRPYER